MKRPPADVLKKAAKIQLLLLDVDGVLTDGRIIIDDRGIETKQFYVRDGQGIALLLRAGIKVGFLSARKSASVRRRAKELGVDLVCEGVRDKLEAYCEIKRNVGFKDDQIAYVGDDIIDLPILRRAGLAVSVRDGWEGLKRTVDYVTSASGGQGAVLEVAELLLKTQTKWHLLID